MMIVARILLIVLLMFINACDSGITHDDPLGFSLRHEAGFTVSFEKGAYIQLVNRNQSARGIIFPFLAPSSTSAHSCIEKVPTIFADFLPGGNLKFSRQIRSNPDEAIGEYSYMNGGALALCSVDGASGVLFLAISDEGVNSKDIKSIIKSFATLSFDEPGKIKSIPGLNLIDWIDPIEGAFRIKVPESYTTEGGLIRKSSVDVRVHVRVSSPDGEIKLGFGDKDLSPFSSQAGAPEGSIYNPGFGTTFVVKRFLSGADFAREYATTNAAALSCPGAQAMGVDLPELTTRLQQPLAQTGPVRTIVSAGEATLSCATHIGYIFAITTLTTQNANLEGTWNALPSGFSVVKHREDEARKLAALIYQSYQVEPNWFAKQQQTTAISSNIVATTGAEIGRIITKTWGRNQVVMDRVFRQWSNATLGQTDVVDPSTGETYKIAAGKNYYWRKSGTNVIAGTNQHERPDIDFSLLLQY